MSSNSKKSKLTVYLDNQFSLGLVNPPGCHKKTPKAKSVRKKSDKLTAQAKRTIKNAIFLLGDSKLLSFLTITVPALSTREQQVKLWSKANDLIRKFNQELKRELNRSGLSGEYVCVREHQKRGEIHWHIVFQGRTYEQLAKNEWSLKPDQITAIWKRVLENLLKTKLDCSAAINLKSVWNSNTLAQYLTKDKTKSHSGFSELLTKFSLNEEIKIPTGRLWNISTSLQQKINEKVFKTEELAPLLFKYRDKIKMDYLYEIKHNGKIIGLAGKFKHGLDGFMNYIMQVPEFQEIVNSNC